MQSLRNRLIAAIQDYGSSERAMNFDAEDMAEYLLETIDELKVLKRPIGSKVRIKEGLIPGNTYGGTGFEEDMVQYLGKDATITYHEYEEDCAPAYLLDIDDSFWSWNEEMLEDVQ